MDVAPEHTRDLADHCSAPSRPLCCAGDTRPIVQSLSHVCRTTFRRATFDVRRAPCDVRCDMLRSFETLRSTCYVRRATFDVLRSTCTFGVLRSTCCVRCSTSYVRCSTLDVPCSTFNVLGSLLDARRFDVLRSTCYVRRAAFDVLRSTCCVRRATFGVRRAAFDVLRSTFNVIRSLLDARPAAFDVQRARFAARRSTCCVPRSTRCVRHATAASCVFRSQEHPASTAERPMLPERRLPWFLTPPLFPDTRQPSSRCFPRLHPRCRSGPPLPHPRPGLLDTPRVCDS